MASQGYVFPFEPPTGAGYDPYQLRWGQTDLEIVRSFGFADPNFESGGTLPAEINFLESLTEEGQNAFGMAATGDPTDWAVVTVDVVNLGQVSVDLGFAPSSCLATGYETTFGSVAAYAEYEGYRRSLSDLLFRAEQVAINGGPFNLALAQWRACIRTRSVEQRLLVVAVAARRCWRTCSSKLRQVSSDE